MQEIMQENSNPEYWKRRPLIYIMQCYLSGTVSVLMKAWLDIRIGLTDDQVHNAFNLSKEIIANICGDFLVNVPPKVIEPKVSIKLSLGSFSFDKISINQAFDRVTSHYSSNN